MDTATLAELGAVPAEGGPQPTPPADNPNAGTEAQPGTPTVPNAAPVSEPMATEPIKPIPAQPVGPSPGDLADLGAVPEAHADELGAVPYTPEQAARDKHFDWRTHASSIDPDENPAGAANAQEFAARVRALQQSGVQPQGRTLAEQAAAAGGGLLQAGKTVAGQAVGTTKALGNAVYIAELGARQVAAEAAMTSANQKGDKVEAAKQLAEYQRLNAEMARIQAESSASLELSGMAARNLVGTVLSPATTELTPDQQKFTEQKQLERHRQDLANFQAQVKADPNNPLLRDMLKRMTVTVAQDQVQAQKPVDPNAALNAAREEVLNHVSEVAQKKEILAGRGEIAKGNIPGLPAAATPEQIAASGEKFNEPGAIETALGTTPVEAAAPSVDMLAYAPVFGATGRLLQLGAGTRVGAAIGAGAEKAAELAGAATRQVLGRTVQAAVSTPAKVAAGIATGSSFGHEILGGYAGKLLPTGAIGQAAKDFAQATPGTIAGAAGDIVAGGVERGLKAGTQGVLAGAPFIATSDDPAAAVGENFGFGLIFGLGGKRAADRQSALQNSQKVTAEGLQTLAQDDRTANVIGNNDQAMQTAGLWQGILQRLDPRLRLRVLSADDFAAEATKRDPNATKAGEARGFYDPATNEVMVNGTNYLGEVAGHEGGHALFGSDMADLLPDILKQKLGDSVDAALLAPKKDAQGKPLGGQAAIGQPTPLLRQIAERYGKELGRKFDLTNPQDIEYLRNELIAETSRSLTSGEGDLAKFFSGPAAGQRGAEYLRDRLKDIFPRFAQNKFEFGFREAPKVTQAVRDSLYELGNIAREGTNQVNPESEAAQEAEHQRNEAARTPGTPQAEGIRADAIKALRAVGHKPAAAAALVDQALASGQTFADAGALTYAIMHGQGAKTGRTTPGQTTTLTPGAPKPAGPTGPQVTVPDAVSFNDNSGSVPTQYRIVEASDVEADPNNERPQPGSPAATQLQQRNAQAVQNFDPTKVINTSPSPSNGPTIVYKVMDADGKWTGKYRIAGGHQRTEIINQAGDKYTEALKAQGQAYDPDYDPAKVQQPLLVREIDAPADERSRADLVRRLNDTETAGQDVVSNAVSAGRLLSDQALNHIATTASNPVGTPRANLLASDTRELRADMVKSGIIRPQDMERMVAPDGRLTAEGVDLALQATVGSVLGDVATIRDALRKAPGVLQKLETILPQILRAKANGVDIAPVAEAVRLEVARGSQSVADFQAQPPVVGEPPSREAMRIQQILAEQGGQGLRDAFDKLVGLTAPNEAGQASMFGENRQSIGDITDQELGQILGGERVTHDLTPRISPFSERPGTPPAEPPVSPLGTAEPAEATPTAPQEAPRQISTLTPREKVQTPTENRPAEPEQEAGGENRPSAGEAIQPTRQTTLPPIAPAVAEAAGEGAQSPLGEKPGNTAPLETINNHMPGVTTPSKESRSIWGRIKGMLPKFQGNKTVMGDYVVSAIRRYWTPEQRQAVRTIVDSFAGGGAWGFGLGETGLFPNVDRYIVNEFDPHRAVRIRQQYENGDQFADWAHTPEVGAALQAIVDAAAARKGEGEQMRFLDEPGYQDETKGNSWGGIVNDAVKILAGLDPADPANAKVIAVLKTMTDDPDRSGLWHGEEALSADALRRWFLKEHAPRAAEINRRYREATKRGVNFEFRQGDAYDPALYQDLHGPSTLVVADPPYFGTTGYGNDEAAEGTKNKDIVGLDIYRKTADLMKRLAADGHSVIYTDEAWWLKPDIGKNLTDGAMNDGTRMASDIANSLDLTVVDGKIDSRYETLGLHNGQSPRANAARGATTAGEAADAFAAEGAGSGGAVRGGRATEQAGRPIHGPFAEPSPLAGPHLEEAGPTSAERGPGPTGDEGQVGKEGERLLGGAQDLGPQAPATPVAPAAGAGGSGGAGERPAERTGRAQESPLAGRPGESRQPSRSAVDAQAVRRAMDAARDAEPKVSKTITTAKDKASGDPEAARAARHAEKLSKARDVAEAAPLLEALEQHARDNGIDPNAPQVGFLPAPEDPKTLQHQRDQLESGRRMAMLYTPGEKELPVPPTMARIETSNGVYHYDPKKILGAKVQELDRRGLQNLLLNLGPQNKAEIAAAGQRPQVVTERAPDGTEVRAAAVTPDRAQSTLEEMQRQATPGHKMAIESLEDVLGRRPAFLPASTEESPLADRVSDTRQGERYKGLTARTLATPNPETGIPRTDKKYSGKFIDPADPLHKLILEHNGIDDEMANQLNDSIEAGQPVMIGYGHAKAGDVVTAGGRKAEQKTSPARERLQQANTAQVGDKVVVPTSFDVSQDGSLNFNAFDFDKFNQNATHLLEFMQQHLPEDAAKLGFNSIDDRAYQDAAKDYADNHAHGYKGDGSAPLRPTADVPTGFDPGYKPKPLDKTVADFLNAAYGNTSAMSAKSAGGAQARELAKANQAYPTTPEPLPDVNPLRARINAMVDADGKPLLRVTRADGRVDEGYNDVMENVNSTLKAGLVDSIQPAAEALRDTGIRQVGEALSPFGEGPLPKVRFASAGFLPAKEGGRFDDNRRQEESPLAEGERTDAMGTRSRDITRPGQAGATLRFGEPTQPEGRLHAAEDGLETKQYGNGAVTGPGAFFLPAYHGTGHKFDKFDISKIGTGEGAQVYGWGLYFASQRKTAMEYRRNLSAGGNQFEYDGKRYDRGNHDEMENFVDTAIQRVPKGAQEAAMEVLMDWAANTSTDLHPDYVEGVARGVASEHGLNQKNEEALVRGLQDVAKGLDGDPVGAYAGDATSVVVPRLKGGKRTASEMSSPDLASWIILRDRIGSRNAEKWDQAKIADELTRNATALEEKIARDETTIESGKLPPFYVEKSGLTGQDEWVVRDPKGGTMSLHNTKADAQESADNYQKGFNSGRFGVSPGLRDKEWLRNIKVDLGSKRAELRDHRNALRMLKDGTVKFTEEEPPGHHYEVDLKTDDTKLLDYDKRMGAQNPRVIDLLEQAVHEMGRDWDHLYDILQGGRNSDTKGSQFYQSLQTRLIVDKYGAGDGNALHEKVKAEGPKAASEWLHSAGIDGIKYLDGFSRNKGKGSHNYVMFSDDKIDVKKRNEQPVGMPTDTKGQGQMQFLPKGEGSPLSEPDEQGFYSQLSRVLKAKMPRSATAAQVRGIIDPAKGSGVKSEEIKWSGLEDYLAQAGDKVSKEDLLQHIREQAPQFGESTYGGPPREMPDFSDHDIETRLNLLRDNYDAMTFTEADAKNDLSSEWQRRNRPNEWQPTWLDTEMRKDDMRAGGQSDNPTDAEARADLLEQHAADQDEQGNPFVNRPQGATKFSQYVSPGGENYREKVRTMKSDVYEPDANLDSKISDLYRQMNAADLAPEEFRRLQDEREKLKTERDNAKRGATDTAYSSSHFSDAGDYIYHTRVSDAQDAQGQPGTLIHEIQSDRHQKARKEGYKGEGGGITELPDGYKLSKDPGPSDARPYFSVISPDREIVTARHPTEADARRVALLVLNAEAGNKTGGIPDAPFRKDWALQGFKDNLKDAVAAGHKWIGWDDGQTNADRYSLASQVESIDWDLTGAGKPSGPRVDKWVRVFTPGGGKIQMQVNPKGEVVEALGANFAGQAHPVGRQLEDVIGKEVAQRIMDAEKGELSGEGLKIGGKGMIDFYDKILPAEVAKYVKKWGAKPQLVERAGDSLKGRFEVRAEDGESSRWNTRQQAEEYIDRAFAHDDSPAIIEHPGGELVKPVLTEMQPHLLETFQGAEDFENGDRPLAAETKIKINNEDRDVMLIADPNSLQIHDQEGNSWMLEYPKQVRNNKEGARLLTELLWGDDTQGMWGKWKGITGDASPQDTLEPIVNPVDMKMWRVPITPEMAASVSQGQPRYLPAGTTRPTASPLSERVGPLTGAPVDPERRRRANRQPREEQTGRFTTSPLAE